MTPTLRASVAVLGLILSGCKLGVDAGSFGERQPAVIDLGGSNSVQVTLPATATGGITFDVVVTTYGGDCVLQGDTQVTVNGLLAEVKPFDVFQSDVSSAGCNRNLILYAHTASVTLATPGTGTIRIFGRRDPGKIDITVDRTVEVK